MSTVAITVSDDTERRDLWCCLAPDLTSSQACRSRGCKEAINKRRAYFKRPDELRGKCVTSDEWHTSKAEGQLRSELDAERARKNLPTSAESRKEQQAEERSHRCSLTGVIGKERRRCCTRGAVCIFPTFSTDKSLPEYGESVMGASYPGKCRLGEGCDESRDLL